MRIRRAIAAFTAASLLSVAHAQTPSEAPDEPSLAEQIDALRRGELDASIDARELFVLPLDEQVETFARAANAEEAPEIAPDAVEPTAIPADMSAMLEFLRLPAAERSALLDAHAVKHAAFLEREATLRAARLRRVEELTQQADQLEAFLDGRLASDVDALPLLQIDLLAPHDLGLDAARARDFEDPPLEGGALRQAERRLDALRRRYISLDADERAQLLTAHRERPEHDLVARQVADERARAAEEERNAASEAARLLASERGRLLETREAQNVYAAELEARTLESETVHEEALSWVRRVRDFDGGDADELYSTLVSALTRQRAALRTTLRKVSQAPDVPRADPLDLPSGVEAEDLRTLASELNEEHERLVRETRDARWTEATVRRDAVVEMNRARLTLMPRLSTRRRAVIRGFTPDGWRQVQREVEQIELELRYHALEVPRFARSTSHSLRASPAPILFTVLKLLFALAIFRWWRRRAEALLDELHGRHTGRDALGSTLIASALWYLRQVRSPLEWLALVATLIYGVFEIQDVPEVSYLWTIALWIWIGSLAISLLDAIAARTREGVDDTAPLRFRSLRLVGLTIVVIGLTLSLTKQLVGLGAIYNWVFNGCWLLVLPIALLLVHWWRPTVLSRARDTHAPTRTIRWVAARQSGIVSYVAAAIGGVVLIKDATRRFALRQAGRVGVTQRALAYLFRREAARRAESDDALPVAPLNEDARNALLAPLFTDVTGGQQQRLRELIGGPRGALVALVGERGLGKTTILERASEGLDVVHVRCPVGGYPELLAELARALDLPASADESTIVAHLERESVQAVAIDDAHRLVRPLIGGLKDIDRLLEFAHDLETSTTWIVAMDIPGWQYLRRARGDRAFFDAVIQLPRWTASEIRAWLEARVEAAELTLRFDDLVLPRAVDDSRYGASLEDTARDYYRALSDYADGNPAIALHFFIQSLGQREGEIFVHLFDAPTPAELDELPQSMLFVLRSVIQLGLAAELDVVRCTDLHPSDVSDALRAARTRGFVDQRERRFTVSMHWYRAVTAVLQRHHLLMRAA